MKKKLIEVALPLEAINKASAREKVRQDYLTPACGTPSPCMERRKKSENPVTGNAFVSAEKLNRAKRMRQFPTEAEERAWEMLRDRRLLGLKFRRQQVIRGLIVDFYCAEHHLAIELDGPVHEAQQEYDRERDALLESLQVHVIRIRNADLSRDSLEKSILPFLSTAPASPSPFMEKGSGDEVDEIPLRNGGTGATAYADAVAVYLGLVVSKQTIFLVTQARWRAGEGKSAPAFGRQALPMVWDFADLNPFAGAGGDFLGIVEGSEKTLRNSPPPTRGNAVQEDAATQKFSADRIVSTDPPYYDNIGYADLSDFFYVWLRRALKPVFPDLFATLAVPKAEELVATPYRHGSKEKAEAFFLEGMTQAMHRLAEQAHPAFPVTIYYAFKQAESA